MKTRRYEASLPEVDLFNPMLSERKFLTCAEAAECLGVSRGRISQLANKKDGRLGGFRLVRRMYITQSSCLKYATNRKDRNHAAKSTSNRS